MRRIFCKVYIFQFECLFDYIESFIAKKVNWRLD